MRVWVWSLGVTFISFGLTSPVLAQQPASGSAYDDAAHAPAPVPYDHHEPFALDRRSEIGAQLLLGFPTGLRLQVPLLRSDGWALVAEGEAGVEVTWPYVAVGSRALFPVSGDSHTNAVLVGPGIDLVYAWERNGHDTVTAISPTVTISRLHDINPNLGLEWGADLGVFVINDDGSDWFVIPRASVFAGFRF